MTNTLSARGPLIACTIISRNYLSHAQILAQSFFRHEPEGRFYLLVIDPLPKVVDLDPRIRLLRPEDLALSYFGEMSFKYGVTELATAVKPTLLALLLNQYGEDPVVYFDPDILITGPLDALKQALAAAAIVLTPHLLDPIPQDGRLPDEPFILRAGAYNLGFLAVRKSDQTEAFLCWWEERLRDGCVVDVGRGLMVDQKWVDLVPGLFPGTGILRDPTYNVAYWNIHSRPLEERDGQFLVQGRPLTFFHFSGFSPKRPHELSKHQDRTRVVPGTALAKILERYIQLHGEYDFAAYSQWSCGYSHFDNGVAVSELLRQLYRGLDRATRERFGNPFRAGAPGTFLDWATQPDPHNGYLSPFLLSIYRARPDVANACPDVYGRDREAFLNWALKDGPSEMGYDPDCMRIHDHFLVPGPADHQPPAGGGYFGAEPAANGYRAIAEDAPAAGEGSADRLPSTPLAEEGLESLGQVQAYRFLTARSRQVQELLQEVNRLEHRLREREGGPVLREAAPAGPRPAERPVADPAAHTLLFRGEIRWLSREPSNRLISVLLPVKNGARKLRELLPRVLGQRCRHPLEIIAVDSGSTDDTVSVLREFRTTAVAIDPRSFNHGLTRNLAAQYARGEVLVFLSPSTLPADNGWLANLVAPLEEDPNLAGVCGRLLPRPEADPLTARDVRQHVNASTARSVWGITDWQAYQNLEPHHRRRFLNFHTLSAALRAGVFRQIPFREANSAADLIWGKDVLEAGFKIQYEPSAVAYHSHNDGLLGVFRRLFDDGLACRVIGGKQLREGDLLPQIVQEFRADWRYLEEECRLDPQELEEWRLLAVVRRTAQVLGLWIGMDWDPDQGDLFAHLSLTERIKAGRPSEAGGWWISPCGESPDPSPAAPAAELSLAGAAR